MNIEKNHVFNLMDTNGRRADVINAIDIYMHIFADEYEQNSDYLWAAMPTSLSQFHFYKKAIEQSPETFSEHSIFDSVYQTLNGLIALYDGGNKDPLINALKDRTLRKKFDEGIEKRARHYSSTLVKIGLVNGKRKITDVGNAFLNGDIKRDKFESVLPINDTNLILLRQLLKLRVYSNESFDGKRQFYSPTKMALYLLLVNDYIDKECFDTIIQSLSPYYSKKDPKQIFDNYKLDKSSISEINIQYPTELNTNSLIDFDMFSLYFKNTKSSKVVAVYYDFYKALFDFKANPNDINFEKMCSIILDDSNRDKLEKAFGYGKPVFDLDRSNCAYGVNSFILLNEENDLLKSNCLLRTLYKHYCESKFIDTAREYSDTTKRMLNATGVFKFEKGIVRLAYRELFSSFFDITKLENEIFGSSTEEEYMEYEGNDSLESIYFKNSSILDIINISNADSDKLIEKVKEIYGTDEFDLTEKIRAKTNDDFMKHINEKYPKDKVLELLDMFSDRNNDQKIKNYVNPEATVPTIYEFIVAIAWYYISESKIDLYDCLNLTLNADFEPILHAAGGDGDIIIQELDKVIMLEVTLMNKAAQKKGELEPVLRHSTNLKAKYDKKDTVTFFVADELDFNTISTWRISLLSEQQSTINGKIVDKIVIMPLTNQELCTFVKKGITSDTIFNKTKESAERLDVSSGWRERVVNSLII